jgi:head-tail adaptor
MNGNWFPADALAALVDGVLPAVLTRPGGAQTTLPHTLRRRLTHREAEASGGRYTTADVRWHLDAGALPQPPEIGSTLTDHEGRTWTILQVDHDAHGRRWRCTARHLQLLPDDDERLTVQTAAWTKDARGALVAAWSDALADVPARVQPVESRLVVEHHRRLVRVTHRVYFQQPLPMASEYRLLRPSTAEVLHVVGLQHAERIDRLAVVLAHSGPWPAV